MRRDKPILFLEPGDKFEIDKDLRDGPPIVRINRTDVTIFLDSADQLEELVGVCLAYLRIHKPAPAARASRAVSAEVPTAVMTCPNCTQAMYRVDAQYFRCFHCGNAERVPEASCNPMARSPLGFADVTIAPAEVEPALDRRLRELAVPAEAATGDTELPDGWHRDGNVWRGPEGLCVAPAATIGQGWILTYHGPIVVRPSERWHETRELAIRMGAALVRDHRQTGPLVDVDATLADMVAAFNLGEGL